MSLVVAIDWSTLPMPVYRVYVHLYEDKLRGCEFSHGWNGIYDSVSLSKLYCV